MQFINYIKAPWPWYVAGPLIGLTVPILLITGNRSFGISSNLRHICAACFPASISFFQYNWKAESWNLFFAAGILIGSFVAAQFLTDNSVIQVHPHLQQQLSVYSISVGSKQVPVEVFNWQALLTIRGFLMMVVGGFFIGFGTRYAGGCTSGHAIMGLSSLQWPSLVATLCFMAGGFIMANLILPFILSLH